MRVWADGSRFGEFTKMDAVSSWLVGRPEGKGGTRRRRQRGAGLNEEEVKATGIAIMFTEGRRKGGRGAVKLVENILKKRGGRFLNMVEIAADDSQGVGAAGGGLQMGEKGLAQGANFGRVEINIKILNLQLLYGDCDGEDEAGYDSNMRISKVVLRKERGNP